jgi:hypothetical protein
LTLLIPIAGLEFHEAIHRYRLNGQWLARSVTGVVGHDMPAKTRERIDATKHEWEPRGLTCHSALEAHLLGREQPDPGDYAEWINPLLAHGLWKDAEVLAVEYRLADARKSLAGSFDFLIRTARGSVVLGDLKTVGSANGAKSRKPATEQLGAYCAMAIDHHPMLTIDKCVTFIAGPGVARVVAQEPSECISAWLDCWDRYQLSQPDF